MNRYFLVVLFRSIIHYARKRNILPSYTIPFPGRPFTFLSNVLSFLFHFFPLTAANIYALFGFLWASCDLILFLSFFVFLFMN